MKRQEQQVENTWRLEDIYENEDLFSRDAEKLDALMDEFAGLRSCMCMRISVIMKILPMRSTRR